jgi:DNA-binding IclR family transcriptional regulator
MIQSVDRALEILEAIERSEEPVGVTEIARQLDLKVPTAHHLLQTLLEKRYVAQEDSTQRYRLGVKCAKLGTGYLRAFRVPDAARPTIEDLALRVRGSVIVAAIEEGEMYYVARTVADELLSVNFQRPWTRIDYASACVRVILAYLPEKELGKYIEDHPIRKGRHEDIRSRKDLDRMLSKVRKEGYLEYWREKNTVLAIAAPIRDYTGSVIASVGAGIPGVRFKKSELKMIVNEVRDAASKISAEMGYTE